jgi:hypothetical protein
MRAWVAALLLLAGSARAEVSDVAKKCRWHLIEDLPAAALAEPDPDVRQVLLIHVANSLRKRPLPEAQSLASEVWSQVLSATLQALDRLQTSKTPIHSGALERLTSGLHYADGTNSTPAERIWDSVDKKVLEISAKGLVSPSLAKEINHLDVVRDPRFVRRLLDAAGSKALTFSEAHATLMLLSASREAFPKDLTSIGDQVLGLEQGFRSIQPSDPEYRSSSVYNDDAAKFLKQLLQDSGHFDQALVFADWLSAREDDNFSYQLAKDPIQWDNGVNEALANVDKSDLASRLVVIERFHNTDTRDNDLSRLSEDALNAHDLERAMEATLAMTSPSRRFLALSEMQRTYSEAGLKERADSVLDRLRDESGGENIPLYARILGEALYFGPKMREDAVTTLAVDVGPAVAVLDAAFAKVDRTDAGRQELIEAIGSHAQTAHPLGVLFDPLIPTHPVPGDAQIVEFYADGIASPAFRTAALTAACSLVVDREPDVWKAP